MVVVVVVVLGVLVVLVVRRCCCSFLGLAAARRDSDGAPEFSRCQSNYAE